MVKHNRAQLDFFTQEVYNKLIPEDHQLVKIDQLVDFESIYKEMSLTYSDIGRGSKDPVMMVKIMLLEYLYRYSDVQMEKAIQTDIAIRWFLRLNLDEKGPDASTISYFRVNRIVSVVDPDARVAHKSRENVKVGYKNHIIVDEESELIISSIQTPFNVKDEKRLIEIIERAEQDHGLKPIEVSCDTIYGTYENRQYLEDRNIVGNIAFYNNSNKENNHFGIDDFKISEDLEYLICPAGHKTYNYTYYTRGLEGQEGELVFKFPKDKCKKCPLNDLCVRRKKESKSAGARLLRVDPRYSTAIKSRKHNETKAFHAGEHGV